MSTLSILFLRDTGKARREAERKRGRQAGGKGRQGKVWRSRGRQAAGKGRKDCEGRQQKATKGCGRERVGWGGHGAARRAGEATDFSLV